MTSIEALWDKLATTGQLGGAIRIDDIHPCDLYAAIDAEGRPGLVLVTDESLPPPPALEAVVVTISRRHDGRFSLAFWLHSPTLLTPFAHLCQDLIEESRTIDPTHAGAFLLTRLARWRRLLKGERGMSLSEVRGLIGELIVLTQCLDVWSPGQVVEGWMGPLDAAQDFIFPELRIEAKAIQPNARVVGISSADQLDHSTPMLLAVATLVTVLPDDEGMTLRSLASAIRERLSLLGEHAAILVFEGRLAAAGYSELDPEAALMFRAEEIRYFDVTEEFPSITRGMLPAGVAEIRYDIDLSALLPFTSRLPD